MGYRPLATPRSPEHLGGQAPPRMPAACAASSWGRGALALTLGSAPPEPIGPARLCPPTLPTGRAWGAGRQRQLGPPSHRSSACGVCTLAPCWPRPLVVSPRPPGAAEVGGVSSGPSQRPPLTRGPCSAPVPGQHGLCPRTHSTVKPWVTRQNRRASRGASCHSPALAGAGGGMPPAPFPWPRRPPPAAQRPLWLSLGTGWEGMARTCGASARMRPPMPDL